jgi:hypothetical protein
VVWSDEDPGCGGPDCAKPWVLVVWSDEDLGCGGPDCAKPWVLVVWSDEDLGCGGPDCANPGGAGCVSFVCGVRAVSLCSRRPGAALRPFAPVVASGARGSCRIASGVPTGSTKSIWEVVIWEVHSAENGGFAPLGGAARPLARLAGPPDYAKPLDSGGLVGWGAWVGDSD